MRIPNRIDSMMKRRVCLETHFICKIKICKSTLLKNRRKIFKKLHKKLQKNHNSSKTKI